MCRPLTAPKIGAVTQPILSDSLAAPMAGPLAQADLTPQSTRQLIELHADGDAYAVGWCDALRKEGLHTHLCRLAPPSVRAPLPAHAHAPKARVLLLASSLTERLALLRQWRAADAALPLLVVSRGLRDLEQVLALEMGADDILDATHSPSVLAARLRSLWRRGRDDACGSHEPEELRFGNLELQASDRRVRLQGQDAGLTQAEFELLWLLARRAGHTVTRPELLRHTRGLEYEPHDRSIDSRVYRLRRKLGDASREGKGIRTVRNCGYLFVPSAW